MQEQGTMLPYSACLRADNTFCFNPRQPAIPSRKEILVTSATFMGMSDLASRSGFVIQIKSARNRGVKYAIGKAPNLASRAELEKILTNLPPLIHPWFKWQGTCEKFDIHSAPVAYDPQLNSRIFICTGDITKLHVTAIVNAAKQSLLGGAGIDGAIHAAAGKELLKACKKLKGCKIGGAKRTKGFKLPAKHIIHAVGPNYLSHTPQEASDLLRAAYASALTEASAISSSAMVALPCISTGHFGFPGQEAADIATWTVREQLQRNKKVHQFPISF